MTFKSFWSSGTEDESERRTEEEERNHSKGKLDQRRKTNWIVCQLIKVDGFRGQGFLYRNDITQLDRIIRTLTNGSRASFRAIRRL